MPDGFPLFCNRCQRELHPGSGDFFEVHIEAIADPVPPVATKEDLERDLRSEIEGLLQQMAESSAREAMDQVHRRVTIHLCGRCYPGWIEDPAK